MSWIRRDLTVYRYFRGILFLTTNRVRTIDPAFQSRIHVSLRYSDLTFDARRAIWVAFLTKAHAASHLTSESDSSLANVGHGFTEDEVKALSERVVNGRQIKNAVRTASAIAASSGQQISYAHLIKVLDIMDKFDYT